ncbi:MAG: M56 family metallopeptidase, partial [Sedimentisphaerales bacterium]
MALENILSEEIVQKLGWTLLHFIWQAAAVALLLTILLAVLRKSSANLRYIVACAALGLIVLLPITTMQLVPVSVSQPTANIEPAPAPVILPAQEIREIATVEMSIPEEPVQYENASTAFNASWKQRAADRLEPALPYIVSAWLLGVFGLSLWHLGGWAQLQRLRKQMVKQVDDSLNTKLRRLSERLRVKRAVQLMESALVQVPTVVGWLRPVILLPASALTGLSSEQLEALLAHELAHIRRYDYLVNMLQTVVETLGFYHPAVWWVSHEIRIERENCCDDLAVSISGDRVCYARALTSMEEIRGRRGELAVAAAGGNLFGRIRRLVGKDSADTSRASWIPSVITILLIAIIAIPTTLALTANDKTPQSAQFLLDKMLEHRSRVKNLQYIAEAAGRDETDEHIKWMEDRIKKMREEGASERDIGFSERTLEQWKRWRKEHENRYEIRKCTIDNEGRSKIELTRGDYDASGKKMPDDYKLIRAWNGIQSVEFYQKRGSLPATLEATIKDVPSASIHPWRLFISDLCQYLEETIEAKRDVSVEKLKDGTYRIAFDYKVNDKTTRRIMAVIDPSKGYTCALREDHNDQGKCTSRYTSTYEEVAENIWFPVSGQLQTSSSDSTNYKRSFKSSQIKINGPAFNASYFDVDIPEGTTVTDEVQDKQYIVGSKRVHDLDEPQKPSAKMEQVDPNSWQEKFYSIYRLEDGQVLKRIAPPFIPERRGYFKSVQPGKYSANTPYHLAKQFIFRWDGDLNFSNMHMGEGIPRLSTTLGSAFGLSSNEYDIAPELLNMDMSGDWILRKDTPQEQLLQALEQIIKKETGRGIRFVKQKVETEVIVARGKYHLTPLPNAKKKDCVQVYTDKMDTDSGAGGGSGKLSKFLRFVGNHRIKKIIIDRTESGDVELSWRNHYSSDISWLEQYKQQYKERADMLLNNLSRQMGLTFEREKITVEKWFVAEQESSAESVASSPMIAKSPVSSVADKRHIQIDCLVLEIYAPVRMDRESIIAAQNVLGEIITTRTRGETVVTRTNRTSGNSASIAEKPTVEELIREAAGTTYSVDDSSIVTRDRQATQGQLKPMVDLLVSRGFVKILMNPTLEVVDGGTAQIRSEQKIPSMQDSLVNLIQITPNVLENDYIILQVEANLIIWGNEQT